MSEMLMPNIDIYMSRVCHRTARRQNEMNENWSGRGDSNSRPPAPKAGALPTALLPERQNCTSCHLRKWSRQRLVSAYDQISTNLLHFLRRSVRSSYENPVRALPRHICVLGRCRLVDGDGGPRCSFFDGVSGFGWSFLGSRCAHFWSGRSGERLSIDGNLVRTFRR